MQDERLSSAMTAVMWRRRFVRQAGTLAGDRRPSNFYDALIQADLEPWREHGITEVRTIGLGSGFGPNCLILFEGIDPYTSY